MITIVDYGVGNVGALISMFDHLGCDAEVKSDGGSIRRARKLVLPGVGAFDHAMRELHAQRLIEPLEEAVLGRSVPVLGICLGMQLLARRSEEGSEPGLGWLPADVRRISPPPDSGLKVPHVGWSLTTATPRSVLFDSGSGAERFYFTHSFHVHCDREADEAAYVEYGGRLTCAVHSGNIHGVQFHPEKSHRFGMRLLSAYASLPDAGQP